jgi:putative spermidine/putrescine transport system substrate-binding protein
MKMIHPLAHRSAMWLRMAVICTITMSVALIASCSTDTEFILEDDTTFDAVEELARGTSVRFYMWGGDARINQWIDSFVKNEMMERYDIRVERVGEDAGIFVNKLITEKQAGRESGSIDLVWINGENFRNARESDVLFGPFVDLLPNYSMYVDTDAAVLDFAYPVDGYEAPYGRAQFVFEYDAKVTSPPSSFAALPDWVREHPGKFTYPQPPSFTGSAFIRQALYAVTGGHEQYMSGFDAELFADRSEALWEYLNKLEPFLWKSGTTYPKDKAPLDLMFQRGEVLINMSYHQADASGRIQNGQYPETVRTFVMDEGSLYNTHFLAIAFNAPNAPGAMVLANFLMSPEAQYHKNDPANWGDFSILDFDKLPVAYQKRFSSLDLGIATLDAQLLRSVAVPEIPSEYVVALERGWEEHVLRD